MPQQYTDHFGTPVNEGDEIVYPVASYTGRDAFARVRIEKIIALVPHRVNPGKYLMREDQQRQASPSQYPMVDPDKRFVVQVLRKRWQYSAPDHYVDVKHTIRFCENIIKVPDGA